MYYIAILANSKINGEEASIITLIKNAFDCTLHSLLVNRPWQIQGTHLWRNCKLRPYFYLNGCQYSIFSSAYIPEIVKIHEKKHSIVVIIRNILFDLCCFCTEIKINLIKSEKNRRILYCIFTKTSSNFMKKLLFLKTNTSS